MRGHIRRRGKHSWEISASDGFDSVTGKRRRVFASIKGSKRDAERAVNEIVVRLERGSYMKPSKDSLSEFLADWTMNYAERNVSKTTLVRYQSMIQCHINPVLGHIRLSGLKPADLVAAYSMWASDTYNDGRPLSAQTILHQHRLLHLALRHAQKWQLIRANPVDAVDPPRVRKSHMKILTPDRIRSIFESDEDDELVKMIRFALLTGLRQGEQLALRWMDVKWDERAITVNRTVRHLPNAGFVFSEPKTRNSQRTVTLPSSAVLDLRRLERRQFRHTQKFASEYEDQGLLFCRGNGLPIHATTLLKRFSKFLDDIGIPRVRWHDLRHTSVSMLIQQGVHPKLISDRMGHASVQTTLDRYGHLMPGMQAAVAESLDDWMREQIAPDAEPARSA